MKKTYYTHSPEETILLGKRIGECLNPGDVVLLEGDLSAGKTMLSKGIGAGLGVKKVINSPTFTIVKEYRGRCPFYHLDLYRLNGLNTDFDLEEYMETEGVCVIEWPFQVREILPKSYLHIGLVATEEQHRTILIEAVGPRYEEVLKQL